jgi:hypothetical protein
LWFDFLRDSEIGKKVKAITSKGDMVGTGLVIEVLMKAISENKG